MNLSYEKLWNLLKSNKMKKKELANAAHLSSYVIKRLTHNQTVSLDAILRICKVFHCDIGDVVEAIEIDEE